MRKGILLVIAVLCFSKYASAQIDEGQVGAWYMYFWNTSHQNSRFGAQGDIQYRNWNIAGDLQQLMLRGGVTYKGENSKTKFTLGYANITTAAFGDDDSSFGESRIYQEALIPQKVGSKFYMRHRLRLEQRFVEDQDFRTRFRYALFINVPLNQDDLSKGAFYISFYDELFLNGEKEISETARVKIYDRNRAYLALGHSVSENMKVQFGYMLQSTPNVSKGQLQLSLHHVL